ncbi:peptidase T [Clostridium rectalis]|uniref:peptidase T n=1 Tax=Clostridium rectalis TaxID=2040295 RepID=UPI000F63F307|nr:peptidase T [Clostridium rectalis]
MLEVVERFLRYTKINTKSDENTGTSPSTAGQIEFAKKLKNELIEIGLKNVSLDKFGYVMGEIPANTEKKVKTVGFIAHMDTSPDMNGKNVNAKIVEKYDGKDIILSEEKNIVLSPKDFKELKNYIGQTLITTDGTSLLGADDKAGIAEIITAVKYIIDHPEIKHGKICIAFTPDEEIGCGADNFDVGKFNADFAFTVDGGTIGELEYENFNATCAKICINGRNVHPGSAKDKMINSMTIAAELINSLPKNEVPERTEKYEGFYHLISIKGEVEKTELQYIIRDFEKENFKKRKENLKNEVKLLNKKYGEGILQLVIKDQYYNMKEKIQPVKYIIDLAYKAMVEAEVKPDISPIRGGTDGARLSFMGLPTPNLFTGGHNFHGKYEYIPVYAMEKAVQVIINIVELTYKI